MTAGAPGSEAPTTNLLSDRPIQPFVSENTKKSEDVVEVSSSVSSSPLRGVDGGSGIIVGSKAHADHLQSSIVATHMMQAFKSKVSGAKAQGKAAPAPVVGSRNPKEWDSAQDVALLSEVVV